MPLSRLVYDRRGSGEPLVLIHGIGHRRQAWAPMMDRLAERYDVIAVDLAGFGESPRYAKGTPYDMENACRDLAENFAEWGIERPHVVGNSLGGVLSLELAARGLARSATVLSPAGFGSRLATARALVILGTLWLAAQLPNLVLRALSRPAWGRTIIGGLLYAHPTWQPADVAYGDAVSLKRSRAFFDVARAGVRYPGFRLPVDVPVTVAWGTKDLILPFDQSAVARERLPEARHVTLEGVGHVPMYEATAEIVELIQKTTAEAV